MIQSVGWKEKSTKSWEVALFYGRVKEDKHEKKSKEEQSDMGEIYYWIETKRKEYFKKCQEVNNVKRV